MREKKIESRRKFIKKSALTGVSLAVPVIIPLNISGNNYDKLKPFTIDTDFENGNLGIYNIVDQNTISIGPISGHKDRWFSFRIKGVKHRKITMIFEWINSRPLPENYNGAVNDAGMVTYDGKGFEIIKDVRFAIKDPSSNTGNYFQTLIHTFREDEALVSYCAPWTNTRLAELAAKLQSDPHVQVDQIGYSKFRKLPITYFKITDRSVPDTGKKKFFLIAREDSYEAGGSWAVEGLIKFILSEDPIAKEMLKKMAFIIFPIFSADGVAIGSTNFPLDPQNSEFVYVTAYWDRDPAYYEVQLMKDFWHKLKNEGFNPDICFKLHATCYWECHFRPEDCAEHNIAVRDELFGILKHKLSWRIKAGPHRNPRIYLGYNFLQVFPESITYSSHNDFIFTGRYLGTENPVYRRHEDVMQDGELIARSFAEFYGISSGEVAPYLMAGDVDRNCGKKGETITYSVYYYDVNQLPPQNIELVVNNRSFKMSAGENTDFSKPVLFTCELVLDHPENNYFFIASNGKKERRIPEDNYALPGPFVIK